MTFTATQRIGEIVAAFPGASNLFKTHGIDFCCGGGRPLAEALRQKGLAEEPFMAELERFYENDQRRREAVDTDWRVAPLGALVERIVSIHHGYLKTELPILSQFTTKIAHVHGERHPELTTLSQHFHAFKAELDSHMVDEESRVFPLVLAYEQSGSAGDLARALETLEELESEHQAAGNLLFAMRDVTGGYSLPADACRTYTLSFYKLEELENDMFMHIHLENNILFERLRAAAK